MASAVEQFASNFNLDSFLKAKELHQRLWFTLGALLVFRIGTYVPLPGIDPQALQQIFQQKSGGLLDMFNTFSGGSLQRMAIFALGVMPYISASIIISVGAAMSPQLEAMRKEGEAGRKKLNQYTRYFTILLAAIQAYIMAVSLEHYGSAVISPGIFFRITTVITIVGSTVFLMWLGEQITARGVGNGMSLIICAGILAGIPRAVGSVLALGQEGSISPLVIIVITAMVIGVVAFVVFMERAQRRVVVQYPKRMVGNRMSGGDSSHMPLKLNSAGVMGPIFASSFMSLPLMAAGFLGLNQGSDMMGTIIGWLQFGHPAYMVIYGALVAFFTFFYIAISPNTNTDEIADNLRKQGGFVPGIRPGGATADYLDYILTRITVIGAAYLVFVCLLPQVLISKFSLPFYFGGTSLLIVVSVTMDTAAQIYSHMIAHQYEGLIKKARLRGARK